MNTLESRCATAYNDTGIDSSWVWEPPVQRTRHKTHYIWFKPNGHFVLDPWYPKGPLVHQPKLGTHNPEHVRLPHVPDTPTFTELNTEKHLASVSRLAAKLGVSFDDAGQSTTNTRTSQLQQIARQLVKEPVKHVERELPDDALHHQDNRIITSPTVCGEYQVTRSAVQTERYYGR